MLSDQVFTFCRLCCSFEQGRRGTSPPTALRCGSVGGKLSRHPFCLFCHTFIRIRIQIRIGIGIWRHNNDAGVTSYMIHDIWPGTVEEGRWPAHRHHLLARPPSSADLSLTKFIWVWQNWFEFDKIDLSLTNVICNIRVYLCELLNEGNLYKGDQSWKHQSGMNT